MWIRAFLAIITILILIILPSVLAWRADTKQIKSEKYRKEERIKELALLWYSKPESELSKEQIIEVIKQVEKEFPQDTDDIL